MKYVSNKTKFDTSTFNGNPAVALGNGYVAVSDEDYDRLCARELCWQNGVLTPYTKTAEDIQEEENAEKFARIRELKALLSASDYKVIKHAEGREVENYAAVIAERQAYRDEINTLEAELEGGGGL